MTRYYREDPYDIIRVRVSTRYNCPSWCDDEDRYSSVRLTTGTGRWTRNRVLRSYDEEEYYLCRETWRTPKKTAKKYSDYVSKYSTRYYW